MTDIVRRQSVLIPLLPIISKDLSSQFKRGYWSETWYLDSGTISSSFEQTDTNIPESKKERLVVVMLFNSPACG
ncbi:hypothetical protein AVEN_270383-1, partial [Araneus ventricosus]